MRGKANFNKQVADVKDTIRWIYKNKSNYNLNPNEIGVIYKSSEELYDKCVEEHVKVELITLNSNVHDLSDISNADITSISEGLLKFVVFNSPL